jgi:hypothetical protein
MTSTPSPDRTEPSAEALEAARALVGKHWRVKGYRVQGDFELMEREAAIALDRFRAAGVRKERERCKWIVSTTGTLFAREIQDRIDNGASS